MRIIWLLRATGSLSFSLSAIAMLVVLVSPAAKAMPREKCKYESDYDFLAFLRNTAEKVASDKHSVNSTFLDRVSRNIDNCDSLVSKLDLNKCTSNFKRFAQAYGVRQHTKHKYGFLAPDADYLNDPVTQKMIALPEEFRDGLPSNWKDIAERNKWPYAEFGSSIVGNKPYYSFKRLTFLIDRPQGDLWVQFTRPDFFGKALRRNERLINVIGVQKSKDPSARAKPYFAEYFMDSNGKRPRVHTKVTSCYECHANGMRAIVPALGTVPEGQNTSIDFLNRKMDSYGPFDWSAFVDTRGLGPMIGRKQSCFACHNDKSTGEGSRAALRYYTDFSHIKAKMVHLLQMPQGLVQSKTAPNLAKALAEVDDLTETQKLGIFSPFQWRWTRIYPYRSELNHYVHYISDLGLISRETEKDALSELHSLISTQNGNYEKMMSDYAIDLKAWLLPEDKCK